MSENCVQLSKSFLRPFLVFALCLTSAIFKTGTRVIVKHLKFMEPIILNCIQYFVLSLLAQPIAVTKLDTSNPAFQISGKVWALILRALIGASANVIGFYSLQVSTKQYKLLRSYHKYPYWII